MAKIVRVGDLAGGRHSEYVRVHGHAERGAHSRPWGCGHVSMAWAVAHSSHCSATMIASGVTATLNGVRILVEGDLATCGHAAVASSTADIS